MKKSLEVCFIVSLILFLLTGSLLVIGQVVGILIQNGELITKSHEIFSKPAFLLSAMAGVIAYLLKQTKKQKVSEESSEA
ncbi:hypothetical protein [Brevibacillus invocatus]|uniref:hypothetical protein n=1 Tax=Brevibacillus invocatus TaxID=173959 RepID=UPI00203E94E6|nr:hypothetical protein [Brevibacillus invocatus]MCM3080751.1 hypothetical protein [Brevibacillus invocatus]MCM3430828.1 hypothetical protein [Brevibacillus invocatus]